MIHDFDQPVKRGIFKNLFLPDGDAISQKSDVPDDEDEDALDGPLEEVAKRVAVVVEADIAAGLVDLQ